VPTPLGPVTVNAANGDVFKIEVSIPRGSRARIGLPRRIGRQIMLDGKLIAATAEGPMLSVGFIEPGRHIIESH